MTELSYGQDVHRRVGTAIGLAAISFGAGALMMFAKSKKHFIGLTWDDAGKKGGIAIQADKNDYRGLLTALEGLTGKKAVNADAMTVKNKRSDPGQASQSLLTHALLKLRDPVIALPSC